MEHWSRRNQTFFKKKPKWKRNSFESMYSTFVTTLLSGPITIYVLTGKCVESDDCSHFSQFVYKVIFCNFHVKSGSQCNLFFMLLCKFVHVWCIFLLFYPEFFFVFDLQPTAKSFGKSPTDRHMSLQDRKAALYDYARRWIIYIVTF